MNAKITKQDVFLYFSNKLERARRREIETACQTDENVQRLFAEFTPTDEELEREPLPKVVVDTPEYRRNAAMTYQSVARTDDHLSAVATLFAPGFEASELAAPWSVFPAKELFSGSGGRLAYRVEVPLALAAELRPPTMTAIEIPCIKPDFANGRLTIRQRDAAELASGQITVFAAKRTAAGELERFGPVRVQMDKGRFLNGMVYWYKEIPISSLIPNLGPADDVVFYVEPGDGSDGAG